MFAFLISTFNSNKINKTHTVLCIPSGRIVIWYYFQYKNNTWATSSDWESQHLLGSRTTNNRNNPQIDSDSRTTDFNKFFEFSVFNVFNIDQGNSVRGWTICMNSVNKIITSFWFKSLNSQHKAQVSLRCLGISHSMKNSHTYNVNTKQKQIILPLYKFYSKVVILFLPQKFFTHKRSLVRTRWKLTENHKFSFMFGTVC